MRRAKTYEMIQPDNQKSSILLRLILFGMSGKKLARNFKLLLTKTTLDITTKGTTKVSRIEDFVVNVDQALTSNPILLSNFKLLKTTKLQLIILLIRLLLTETLIERDIRTALDLATIPTITLTRIITQNNTLIIIQTNTLNFKNLFRIESVIRIVIGGFVQASREKVQKRSFSIVILLRFYKSF